jgi:hypothetical protein
MNKGEILVSPRARGLQYLAGGSRESGHARALVVDEELEVPQLATAFGVSEECKYARIRPTPRTDIRKGEGGA